MTQTLALLHDDFVLDYANYFAQRVMRDAKGENPQDQIDAAFRIVLGRRPSKQEAKWCGELLGSQIDRYEKNKESQADARGLALTQLCHILLNTNEFLYIK